VVGKYNEYMEQPRPKHQKDLAVLIAFGLFAIVFFPAFFLFNLFAL
jgi:hypothetical protein